MARIGLNGLLIYTGAFFRNAGVSRYSTGLIEALAQQPSSHSFQVFLNDSVAEPPFAPSDKLRTTRTWLPTSRTPVRILWEQLVAPWRIAGARLDLMHSLLNVVPLASPARQIVTVHDLSFLKVPGAHPPLRRWYLVAATRLSVRRAAAVLADSQATKSDLVGAFGVAPDKIEVVYPGVEPDFHPRSEDELAAFRATQRLQRPFVLFVGTLEPRKNLDTLVRAYARLRRAGAFAGELVIAGGTGWGDTGFAREVRASGFAADIRHLGYVKRQDLPLWYTAADLLVYPSSYEGFGIPVLEAMASGTPVITSNRSSLPEVVGDAGPTVDPRDDLQLAATMAEVLASKERRQQMRARGLVRAQRFQWTAAAQQCLSVYQRVLKHS